MSKLCTVVFTGKLLANIDPDTAAKKFASVFKVPEEKALQLIRDGLEKPLKKDVDPAAAAHYRDVLADIGLQTRIDTAGDPIAATAPRQCPKCGSTQVDNGVCKSCGVLIEAYLANQAAARKAQAGPPPAPEPPPVVGYPRDDGPDGAGSGPAIGEPIEARPRPEPRGTSAGQALSWINGGWELFKQAWLHWIVTLFLFLVIIMVASLVPIIGGLASGLLSPILMAGFMTGAHHLRQGEEFRIGDLFEGFSHRTGPLLGVGGLYLLGSLFIGLVIAATLIGPMLSASGSMGMDPQALENQNPEVLLEAMGPNIALSVLLAMALAIPLMMAYWFAPALVMLDNLGAVEAMKLSFIACLRNILPFLVYGVIGMLLMFVAIIPFGLGLIVLSPVMIASMYTAYEDIFF